MKKIHFGVLKIRKQEKMTTAPVKRAIVIL